MIVFFPLLIVTVDRSLKETRSFKELAICLCILNVFIGWVFLSQAYPLFEFRMGLIQYKDIITTLAGCWFIRVLTSKYNEATAFIRMCLFTVAISGILKLLILLYAYSAGVPVAELIGGISRLFGVQLMTMDLSDFFGRVEFTSDTLVPICIFTVLCMRKRLQIGNAVSLAMIVLFILSSILTFSRFIWANALAGFILGMLVAKKDRMHVIYIGVTTAATIWYFYAIAAIVNVRFSERQTDSSDMERIRQNVALKSFFMDAPIFGHGLGSYSVQVIRSPQFPYSYESQMYALAGQVGIVGMLLLSSLIVNYYRKAFTFKVGARIYECALLLMLIFYLANGFVNPTLVSSVSSVSFGLIFVLAYLGKAGEDQAKLLLGWTVGA